MFTDLFAYAQDNWQILAFFLAIGVFQGVKSLLREKMMTSTHAEQEMNEQKAWAAAHMVHESRRASEEFFVRNPHESFSSPRGKAMLLHHLAKYEAYLRTIGIMPVDGVYHDAYWAQLKKLEAYGGRAQAFPSLPGMNAQRGRHRPLAVSK